MVEFGSNGHVKDKVMPSGFVSMMHKLLFYTGIVIVLTGCVSNPAPDATLLQEIRGTGVHPTVDILSLSEEIKNFVDQNVDPRWRPRKRLEALRDILFAPEKFAIEYESGTTKTAVETYQSGSGNCMSMTSLFISMARYSRIDANYHLVNSRPEWDQSGATLISTQHINSTGLLRSGERYVLDFLPELTETDAATKTVTDQYALAIYYNNLAAEAFINGQYQRAVTYIQTAIQLAPEMADAWNNMGATQNRLGRIDLATASYQQAIHLDPYNRTAMSNLSRIYYSAGDIEQGKYYEEKVQRYRKKNPFYRFANARMAFSNGEYLIARDELSAAIRLKEDEPIFFDALADVYDKLGDQQKRLTSLRLAKILRDQEDRQNSHLEIIRSGDVILR